VGSPTHSAFDDLPFLTEIRMRHDLKVSFADKDAAKKLGARWDAARKVWYIADNVDIAPFSKWSPTPHDATSAMSALQKSAPARIETTGKAHVGSNYVERSRVCECLPWDVCVKCQATALVG
jgi:hypothetical protein